jgi:hypothetical protein
MDKIIYVQYEDPLKLLFKEYHIILPRQRIFTLTK